MIKPEMVPDEVVEAARRAYETDYGHELSAFTSAIAAALNAWPGMSHVFMQPHRRAVSYSTPALILPLTENPDDKA